MGLQKKKDQQLPCMRSYTIYAVTHQSCVYHAPQGSMGTESILERFADMCVEGTHVKYGLGVFPGRA